MAKDNETLNSSIEEVYIPRWIHRRTDLSIVIKYFFGMLFTLIKVNGREVGNYRELEISISDLASIIGCDEDTIKRHIRIIRAEQLILINRTKSQRPNIFRLHKGLFSEAQETGSGNF